MRAPASDNLDPTPLRTYVSILARRKWLFILVLLVVPVVAVLLALQGASQYQAKSQVLLTDQGFTGALAGTQSALALDPDRVLLTQARIARTPELVRRVKLAAKVSGRSVADLLQASDVLPVSGANVLEFTVVDRQPRVAERVATQYAEQFVLYSRKLETASIQQARARILAEMARVATQGGRDSELYSRLSAEADTLQTTAALRTSNAQVLRGAEPAVKVAPRPARSGAFGFAAAVLLALGLVGLLEALDTRVRSEIDVTDALGIPLLGRIAEPPRHRRGHVGVAVLDEPDGADAEAFRILRANIEYANSGLAAQTIMFTSAVRGEGKSTSVVNIAASFARLGRRVVLVDLDLRRPSVHVRLGLRGDVGVSDVARGRVGLDAALVRVPIETRDLRPSPNGRLQRWTSSSEATAGATGAAAVLEVLPAGATPSDVGEFVGAKGVAEVLSALSERADLVFVDAPPLLDVSDPMTLMRHVDAVVAVAHLGIVRQPMLKEFRRALEASAVPTLGLVITGTEPTDDSPYVQYRRDAQADDVEEPVRLSGSRFAPSRSQRRSTTG